MKELSEHRIWRIVRNAYNSCGPEHDDFLVACRDCMTKAVKQAVAEAAGSVECPDWLLPRTDEYERPDNE